MRVQGKGGRIMVSMVYLRRLLQQRGDYIAYQNGVSKVERNNVAA